MVEVQSDDRTSGPRYARNVEPHQAEYRGKWRNMIEDVLATRASMLNSEHLIHPDGIRWRKLDLR